MTTAYRSRQMAYSSKHLQPFWRTLEVSITSCLFQTRKVLWRAKVIKRADLKACKSSRLKAWSNVVRWGLVSHHPCSPRLSVISWWSHVFWQSGYLLLQTLQSFFIPHAVNCQAFFSGKKLISFFLILQVILLRLSAAWTRTVALSRWFIITFRNLHVANTYQLEICEGWVPERSIRRQITGTIVLASKNLIFTKEKKGRSKSELRNCWRRCCLYED